MAVRIESHAEPIPGYKLIERLGGGGFGEVWKAEAPGGLHKAIKFVFGDLGSTDDGSQRAEQELKALSRVKEVRHPYILSLERYDIIDGQLIIVMELAERNLWDRFKECRSQGLPGIPRDELLIYMEETAEALDLMNSTYQLQHLDIKPQNLFLMFQHVKVADFGLVKDLEGMQASVTGGVTPVYAAPETFDGWVSRFCDQYSLAIVYQELLTGQRPFSGNNVRQLILQHLQATPNLSSLPPGDQAVIARALAKVPDQRYPSCREMVRLLRQNSSQASGEAPASAPSATPASAPKPARTPAPAAAPQSVSLSAPTRPAEEPKPAENTSPPTANIRSPRSSDSKTGVPLVPAPTPAPAVESTPVASIAPARRPPTEVIGEGFLFPALVIGVGQLGMQVLQRLRDRIVKRFGSTAQLPNVRMLLLDTDQEIVKAATRGPATSALSVQEIVLTPLHRPSHYLRPREGRIKVEAWLDPRMVYRIPRSQATNGVRALGRLAFIDNHRAIVRRLQNDLDACLNPNVLMLAGQQTGLGVRSNRPRVYVVAGIAGGAGGGMFLDLTYTVRNLLKQAGYNQPDVTGLFFLPPTKGRRARTLALGNAYAALTEMTFFSTPGNSFAAQYHEREAPLLDPSPPFARCFVLPLSGEGDAESGEETLQLAGHFVYRDLTSPLAKAADDVRFAQARLWPQESQTCSTFGLYQVAWPRRELLRNAARRLCHQLVQRWMSKDAKPVAKAAHAWIDEEWKAKDLGADHFIAGMRELCEQSLGKAAEDVFHDIIAPLKGRAAGAAQNAPAAKKGKVADAEITAHEIEEVLWQFDALIGRPQDESCVNPEKNLLKILRTSSEELGSQWEQKLLEFPVRLIEKSEFRLAGAEEAVRHSIAAIEQMLQHHEPLVKDLTKRAGDAYLRLRSLVLPVRPGGRWLVLPPEEVLELMRCYPKWRYQALMLQHVGAAFVGLRGHLSDELREINFLRARLTELGRLLETPPEAEKESTERPPLTRCVFPAGCQTMKEATDRFVEAFTPELLLQLDEKIQEVIRRDFTALVHICMTSKDMTKDVENAMIDTAMEFAGAMLAEPNVADLLLEQFPEADEITNELADYFSEAAPELADRPPEAAETVILAAPPGAGTEALTGLTKGVIGDAELTLAPSHDDIILYREVTNVPLADLEQMGDAGQEAYRHLTKTGHFTPHTRIDIEFETEAKKV
jgi:serine/threonine protein kinase